MPVSNVISLSGTTPVAIVVVPPLSKVKIKKIMAYNGDTADHRVQIGHAKVNPDGSIDATTFTQILPDLPVLAGQAIVEPNLPEAEAQSTKTTVRALVARLEAAVTSANVDIVVEYEFA